MQQPYSGWAKALLERQHYPDQRLYPGGPPKRPYDVTAHTLPLLMGVDVKVAEAARGVSGEWQAPSRQAGPLLTGAPTPTRGSAVNRAWSQGHTVWRDPATGDFSLADQAGWREVRRPRIAALSAPGYPTWTKAGPAGCWSSSASPTPAVHNREIQAGALLGGFDVLVFPDQNAGVIESGYRSGAMPDEYVGGLGQGRRGRSARIRQRGRHAGVPEPRGASTRSSTWKLPVTTVTAREREFYSPGSLLNVNLDTRHPLTRGVPPEIAVWSEQSPAWETLAAGGRALSGIGGAGFGLAAWARRSLRERRPWWTRHSARATCCCSECGRSTGRRAI